MSYNQPRKATEQAKVITPNKQGDCDDAALESRHIIYLNIHLSTKVSELFRHKKPDIGKSQYQKKKNSH